MKHLFLVHSPITYLISVSIITELKIAKEDAVIVFHEFDEVDKQNDQYIGVIINRVYIKKLSFRKFYNYIRYFNIINRIDRLVNAIIKNQKFISYIPVLTYIGKSLITHPNCTSFSFIEEGLGHYYKEETVHSLTATNSKDLFRSSGLKNIRRVLSETYLLYRGYNFKLQALPFSYSCYHSFKNVGFYGLSSDSFPLIDQEKKIIIPFVAKNFGLIKQDESINLNSKIIWVGDGSVSQHGFSQNLYLEGIKEGCIRFLKEKETKNIFIKFHRDETNNLRKIIKKIFEDNQIEVQVIPDSVIMDLLLFIAEYVILIGVYSSLLYYASVMGHTSFSIYEFLKKEYSKVLKNRNFDFYWDKVKLIKSPVPIALQ